MRVARAILVLIDIIFGIIETLVGLRIILKLFGASTGAPFVRWVYETSQPLLQPFLGAFPAPKLDGRFVIEFSALFALIIYALVAYVLTELLDELDYSITSRRKDR